MAEEQTMRVYLGVPKDTTNITGPFNAVKQIKNLFPPATNIQFHGHGKTEDHMSFDLPFYLGEKMIGYKYSLFDVHGNVLLKRLSILNHNKMFIRVGSVEPMRQLMMHFPHAVLPKIFYNNSGIYHAEFWLHYKEAKHFVGKRFRFNNRDNELNNKLSYYKFKH